MPKKSKLKCPYCSILFYCEKCWILLIEKLKAKEKGFDNARTN